MCVRFEDRLKDEIRINEEKRYEFEKRSGSTAFSSSQQKKLKESSTKFSALSGFFRRDQPKKSSKKAPAPLVVSVGNVWNTNRTKCKQCRRFHLGVCRVNDGTCFVCGYPDHFKRECPNHKEPNKEHNEKSVTTHTRGRRPGNSHLAGIKRGGVKEIAVKSKARDLARTYAIRIRREASSPDVIAGHNVIVDLVSKQCPLKIQGYNFPADLMLLPFNEFDVILGINWLNMHDVVFSCRQKRVELKVSNGEILDSKLSEKKVDQVSLICEFSDVFPEELLGLPPE
ncbi:uncharacterized protein LOC105795752 [Gossypium raimondii]|uniref:uncharacterized protein LOC105795752 n=1 Tax=Gossypium raimondii TaxID=29730 RepID=UPI00063AED9F|nr:uncharacterized protein LOC105795752 [Gossypium raimondii]